MIPINDNTICAISTAAGVGGIAVIRVSGKRAIKISDKIFKPLKSGKSIAEMSRNTVQFGRIINSKNEIIDEVLISLFRAPNSFTGEDVVEIGCHGSLFIQQEILKLLIENGCSMAKAGEFTQRAFLNGKMDLSQAEAVADLIASNSKAAHRIALNQMRGGFSDELAQLRMKLLDFTSLVELELDFADHEELEFADRTELQQLANEIEKKISRLTNSFSVGNAIKNGIPVAIVGETNAGKSTLLNRLVGEEKAIVSDIHGTTRDIIEDTVSLNGILFRFIDTAGIRETADTIENLGIERTYQTIEKAQIVLWIIDAATTSSFDPTQLPISEDKTLIIVFNKTDKTDVSHLTTTYTHCFISAKNNTGIDHLQELLIKASNINDEILEDVTVSNARHYESLCLALSAIRRVQEGLSSGLSGDLLSMDLRECINHLGTITGGAVSTDEVLENIFSKFCIGK
ncbi:MAG: tRNA uridine-5-carboxymethylaminomethyl(34) synthesis GTPase MnmE [Paludibacteraceae bacterium]|nr:tRNA uridine-5-carboxymethylaminomethyl(34) synthesis GTPase MnmE [Paludibacteraceae bacterium]